MMKGFGLTCLVVVLTLGAGEGIARLFRVSGAEAVPTLVIDEHMGWAREANQHGFVIQRVPDVFKTRFQTNSLGMRDREHAIAKNGHRRIIGLGDSITEGFGVEEDEIYLKVLESKYLAGVDVWNLGVVGYSTDQELEQLRQVIDIYHPDVVTLAFYFNDLAENTVRAARWEPYYGKPFFTLADSGPVLTNADALRREKSRDITERQRINPVRRFLNNVALYRLAKYARTTYRNSKAQARRAARRGPPSDRVPKWSDLDNLYRVKESAGRDSAFRLAEGLLREINRICNSRGVTFVLTYVPAPIDAIPGMMQTQLKLMGESEPDSLFDPAVLENKLAEIARRDSIRFVPMVSRFRNTADPSALFLPHVPKDPHLGREGHRVVAQALAEYLTAENLLPRVSLVSRVAPATRP
jgi:lysophospholipase L1-like esterase